MGKDRLRRLIKTVFEDMEDNFNDIIGELESPIEEMLCAALLSESLEQIGWVFFEGWGGGPGISLGQGPEYLRISLQRKIGIYRVDFYLEYRDHLGGGKGLIVECDGHDFHEKTKDQAQRDKKRDRILQKTAPVLRFTGSEIWKDAHGCADQILSHLTEPWSKHGLRQD